MDPAAPPPWHALEETPAEDRPGGPHGPGARLGQGPGPSPGLGPGARLGQGPGAPGSARPRQWALVAAGMAAAVVLAGAALVLARTEPTALTLTGIEIGRPTPGAAAAGGDLATGSLIAVDVGGAVRRPGVYRLAAGSRVADAIAAAGGYGPRVDVGAASERLNLAAVLADGERIRVPSRDEPAASAASGSGDPGRATPARGGSVPVDLNRATAAELEALPGIGPVTAAKIIAAREAAVFTSVDDLRTRELVGAVTFGKIRALVTVGR